MRLQEFAIKTITVAKALLSGSCVSEERVKKRVQICAECELVQVKGAFLRCSICGCQVAESGIVNLARYEETEAYGCKHPDGSKWKKENV
jgi:hypothetical protein